MSISIHTFELSKMLTDSENRLLKEWLYDSSDIAKGNVFLYGKDIRCKEFSYKGINLFLKNFVDKNGFTHHRIHIVVNAINVISKKSRVEIMELTHVNIKKLERSFNEIFQKAPCGFRNFNDYSLTRVDLTVDMVLTDACRRDLIDLGNRAYVPPAWHRELYYDQVAKRKKVSDRGLKIASNSKAVILYDKGKQLEHACIHDLDSKDGTGILRAELALYRDFIVAKQDKFDISDNDQRTSPVVFLYHLEREGASYLLKSFQRVFRIGEYRKLDDAMELLDSCGHRENIKDAMRYFMFSCAKHRSVESAVNELRESGVDQREIRALLKIFDGLALNPLAIPRRWQASSYFSITSYIESALESQ